jgi:Na+/melibiose symporter-like transporter
MPRLWSLLRRPARPSLAFVLASVLLFPVVMLLYEGRPSQWLMFGAFSLLLGCLVAFLCTHQLAERPIRSDADRKFRSRLRIVWLVVLGGTMLAFATFFVALSSSVPSDDGPSRWQLFLLVGSMASIPLILFGAGAYALWLDRSGRFKSL